MCSPTGSIVRTIGRNPHTGDALEIPATKAPAFKAGKPLKETLRKAAAGD